MTEPRTPHRIGSNRKKNPVPLSSLRASDVLKMVLEDPRRLEEIAGMLEDRDRAVRDRAAAVLGQLADRHPERLRHLIARLAPSLEDDSAYVRWHLVYILGSLGSRFDLDTADLIGSLAARLDDPNRVVRVTAVRSLARVAGSRPGAVEAFFAGQKREIPSAVARFIRGARRGRSWKDGQ